MIVVDKLKEIKRLEEKLLDNMVRKFRSEINQLLANDFIEYGSSGFIYDKEKTINGLQSEQPTKFGMRDFRIKELATNIILATYIAVKYNDLNIEESTSLRSSIWKLDNTSWQMVFHQGTKIYDDVILVEYDSSWPVKAAIEIDLIRKNCNFGWIRDIEHFGSTAIIGLKSKPIIDLMIGVDNITKAQVLVPILESIGYNFWNDNPKKDRMFFVKGMPPYGMARTHHAHIFEFNSYEWLARKAFRNYLNNNVEEKIAYQNLKENLASKFLQNREVYTLAKTEFVLSIIKKSTHIK